MMYALFEKGNTYFFEENKQTASSTPIVSAIGVEEVSLPTFFSKKVGRILLSKRVFKHLEAGTEEGFEFVGGELSAAEQSQSVDVLGNVLGRLGSKLFNERTV